MIVSHPSNLARLFEFYGGHLFDERDGNTKKVVTTGVIGRMPDIKRMREDIFSVSISNDEHYWTIREVYDKYRIILDPHGAVGWKSLELYNGGKHEEPSVVYETADPGKFPEDIQKAIGITPEAPPGLLRQAALRERVYTVSSPPLTDSSGSKRMSEEQYEEVKGVLLEIFR